MTHQTSRDIPDRAKARTGRLATGRRRAGRRRAVAGRHVTPRKRPAPSASTTAQPSEPQPRETRPAGRASASPNAGSIDPVHFGHRCTGCQDAAARRRPGPGAQREPAQRGLRQRIARNLRPDTRAGQRQPATDEAVDPPTTRVRAESRVQVSARPRGPVRASMQIRRIDPWSTLKVSLVLSVALFFVWMIAVAFLYLVLGGMGVWSKLNSNVGDLLNNTSGQRRTGIQRHDLRRRGADRTGEHRVARGSGHHRRLHLQPDDRLDRRHRGDAGRP